MKNPINILRISTCIILLLVANLAPLFSQSAEELYRLGRFPEARIAFDAQLKTNSRDHAALYWLGRAKWHEDRWDDAIQLFRQAITLNPHSSTYQLWLGRALGDKMRRVNIFEAIGSLDEFKRCALDGIRLDPENLDVRQLWLLYHANAPGIAGGNRELAWAQVLEIRKRDSVYAQRMEAMYLDGTGEFDPKAIAAFRKAVQLGPLVPRNWGVFANSLSAHDRVKEAFEVLLEGWEKSNHTPQLLWYLGRIAAEKRQRLPEAINWLQQYIDAPWDIEFPSKAEAWFYLGEVHKALGKKAEARQAYQNALALLPGQVRALEGLANVQ